MSDTDSGIASPLSPGSVYGFLGHLDKVNGFPKKHSMGQTGREEVSGKNCCCKGERAQVSEYASVKGGFLLVLFDKERLRLD